MQLSIKRLLVLEASPLLLWLTKLIVVSAIIKKDGWRYDIRHR